MRKHIRHSIAIILPVVTIFILLQFFLSSNVVCDSGLTLVSDGNTDYVIAISDSAGVVEKYAAEEFRHFISQMSGAVLEIVDESSAEGKNAVFIGNTNRGIEIVTDNELGPLGQEGFILRTKDNDLAVRGGSPRGTLYGAYYLLDEILGVRWYAPGATLIPEKKNIEISPLNISEKPALEYREPFFHHAYDGDWAARNRANGSSYRVKEKHGGKIKYAGFVHTFNNLVPPDKYFDEHPEYYSEINGKRKKYQLCLTNSDVLQIVKDRVLETAESAAGESVIISVSQNDNLFYCRCEQCAAVDREEASPAGTMIRFVNQVADAVADKYPNVAIDTLAYQYTEDAPLHAKPRPNVIVRLCHMAPSCDFHPLGKCFWNDKYVRNLKAWSRISNRLYVWHYVTDFSHYLMPFPNLNAITKDIAFYKKHNVAGIFAQGSYQSHGGDMAELKAWLLARLMWNPDADAEALIDDFVQGYYGPAAPAMADFINMQRKRVRKSNLHANLFSPPTAGFLDAKLLSHMKKALYRADNLAASNPEASERVRRARLSLLYTQVVSPEIFFADYKPGLIDKTEQIELFNHFKEELRHFNVTQLEEFNPLEKTLEYIGN